MKITCEQCQSSFEVDVRSIPATGLRLTCPRCSASVTVTRPGQVDHSAASKDISLSDLAKLPSFPAAAGAPAMPSVTPSNSPATGGLRYYFRQGSSKISGPMWEKAIISLIEQRQLQGTDEVSLDGKNWQPLAKNPSFAIYLNKSSLSPSSGTGRMNTQYDDLPMPKGSILPNNPSAHPPGTTHQVNPSAVQAQTVDSASTLDWDVIDLPAPKGMQPSVNAQGINLDGFDQFPSSEGNGIREAFKQSAAVDFSSSYHGAQKLSPLSDLDNLPVPKQPNSSASSVIKHSKMGLHSGANGLNEGEESIIDLPAPKDVPELPAPKQTASSPKNSPNSRFMKPPSEQATLFGTPASPLPGPEETIDLPAPKESVSSQIFQHRPPDHATMLGVSGTSPIPSESPLDRSIDLPAPKNVIDVVAPKGALSSKPIAAPPPSKPVAPIPGKPSPINRPPVEQATLFGTGAPPPPPPRLDELDLPAPKNQVIDLPAPKGLATSLDFHQFDLNVSSETIEEFDVAPLSMSKTKGTAPTNAKTNYHDLPIPKRPHAPLSLDNTDENLELAPVNGPDFVLPAPTPTVDVVQPKGRKRMPSSDFVVFDTPPTEDQPISSNVITPSEQLNLADAEEEEELGHVYDYGPQMGEEESFSSEEANEPALEEEGSYSTESRVRRITPRWLGIGAGALILVVGLAFGFFTDFGFFGLRLITGSYARANKAKIQMATGLKSFQMDTYQGYNQAQMDLDLAVKNMPDSPEPYALAIQALAASLYRFGPEPIKRAQVESLLPRLAKLKQTSPQVRKAYGLMALVTSQPAEAIAQLRPLQERDPSDAWTAIFLGWAHLANRDPKAAVSAFARALATNSNLLPALFGLARSSYQLKNMKETETYLNRALSLAPQHPGLLLFRSKLLIEANKNQEAQTILKQILQGPATAAPTELSAVHAALGDLALKQGAGNAAKEHYIKALNINSTNADAHLGLGQLFYNAKHYNEALSHFRQAQSLDPTNVNAAAMVAHSVIAMGNPQEARKALQTIIQIAPNSSEIIFLQGRVDEAADNLASAEKFYREAIQKDPAYFPPYQNLSRILLKQNKTDEALLLLQQADAKIPVSSAVRNAQGEALYHSKQLDKARSKFEEALGLDPNNNDATFNLAKTLIDQNDLQHAREKLFALKAKDKDFPGLSATLGAMYMQEKKYTEASAEYDHALMLGSPGIELRLVAARAYLMAGQPDKVLKQSSAILDANPTIPEARALRAEALFTQQKIEEALVEIQQAIDRESKTDYFITLGKIQEARNRIPEALEAYTTAAKLDPSRIEVRLRRGIMLVKGGTVKDGLQELQGVLRVNPNSGEAYLYLGNAYADLGQENNAFQAYLSAIKKDPNLASAHMKLAQIYYDTKRIDSAFSHLQAATRLAKSAEPWLPDAYYLLGSSALLKGQRDLATKSFEQYLKIASPKAAYRAEVEKKLKQLGIRYIPDKKE